MWSGTKTPSRPSDSASATVSCQIGSTTPYFMGPSLRLSNDRLSDDGSDDLRAFLDQQRLQQGAVTVALVLAVAAHREAGLPRERGQHCEEAPSGRRAHLAPVPARVRRPARGRERLR